MKLNNKFNAIQGRIRSVYQNTMFVKSIFVGCVSATTDLSLIFIFTDLLHWHYWISANVAFFIAVLVNFSLQKFWTFGNSESKGTGFQAFKFSLNALLNLVVNSILIYVLVSVFGIWYLLAQAMITLMLFLFNFAIYRFYIFI